MAAAGHDGASSEAVGPTAGGGARPRRAGDQVLYLSTLAFPEQWLDDLRSVSPRLVVIQHTCETPDEIPARIWRQAQVLHTGSVFPHPSETPRLAWVQLDTSGIDHVVDLPVWRDTGVPFTTIGGVSGRWMAEYVVMMMLAFSHHLPELISCQQARTWPDPAERWQRFMPSALAGATAAIIGFGRIGQATGALCSALGMNVIGVRRGLASPAVDGQFPASRWLPAGSVSGPGSITVAPAVSLREVLPEADFVVVTVPLTPLTRGMLDRAVLQSVKPGAVLVNVARGGVVDEKAVADLLAAGRLAGAAFDVFAAEPLPADHPLWDSPNMIITPHVAGFAGDYAEQVKALVMDNLRRFLSGEVLLNQADRAVGY